jgi:hypothetical protein
MSKNSRVSSKNLNLNSFDKKMLQIQCFRTARLLGGLETKGCNLTNQIVSEPPGF